MCLINLLICLLYAILSNGIQPFWILKILRKRDLEHTQIYVMIGCQKVTLSPMPNGKMIRIRRIIRIQINLHKSIFFSDRANHPLSNMTWNITVYEHGIMLLQIWCYN